MLRFKVRISGVKRDGSANCATTTAQLLVMFVTLLPTVRRSSVQILSGVGLFSVTFLISFCHLHANIIKLDFVLLETKGLIKQNG